MKKGNYAKIIVLAISLFAVFFMGYYVSTLQNNKNASEENKSIAQLQYDAVLFCNDIAEAIVQGNKEKLLSQYYAVYSLNDDGIAGLKKRISLLEKIPIQSYQGCVEAGGERDISATSFWKEFELIFQIDQINSQKMKEIMPESLVSKIQEDKKFVLTLAVCKMEEQAWSYQLISLNAIPLYI